jgi:hypothetical protein
VLEVYHRPYDEDRPVICMDEHLVPLLGKRGNHSRWIRIIASGKTANTCAGGHTVCSCLWNLWAGGGMLRYHGSGRGGQGTGSQVDSHGRIPPGGERGTGEGII